MLQEVEIEIDTEVYLPCYRHITEPDNDIDIELIWGGRDSGKSHFLGQHTTGDAHGCCRDITFMMIYFLGSR